MEIYFAALGENLAGVDGGLHETGASRAKLVHSDSRSARVRAETRSREGARDRR